MVGWMLAIELTDGWRAVLLTGGRIVAVVVLALLANALARRVIRRTVAAVRSATREIDARVPGSLIRAEQIQRAEARAETINTVLRSLAGVTIFLLAALIILGQLKINLAPLIAGAGVASIAVGFGAQSVVRDVLSGIFVLLEDQYGVGDTIDAGPAVGQVERLTLRSTRLRDAAGTVWHIPNGSILRVGNRSQNWSRAVVDITVTPNTDLRQAREVMGRVASDLTHEDGWAGARLSGEPDNQGVQAITAQGATLRIVVDTDPSAQFTVERELRQRVIEAFEHAGLQWTAPPP
jgi:small-conductance mechanosensitive channel